MKAIHPRALGFRQAMALRKKAVDEHLAVFREGQVPTVSAPLTQIVMAHILVGAILVVVSYMLGYHDGFGAARGEVERMAKSVAEYRSPATRCTSWDFAGQGGTKRCITWRRVL